MAELKNVRLRRLQDRVITPPMSEAEAKATMEGYRGQYERYDEIHPQEHHAEAGPKKAQKSRAKSASSSRRKTSKPTLKTAPVAAAASEPTIGAQEG